MVLWVVSWTQLFTFLCHCYGALSWTFAIIIIRCLGVNLFELILFGTLYGTWTWISVSFPRLEGFSAIIQIRFFFSFWDPVMWMLASLMLSQRSQTSLVFFFLYFFLFSLVNFHISVFQVAVSSNLLLISFLCINFSYYSSALFHSSLYFLILC